MKEEWWREKFLKDERKEWRQRVRRRGRERALWLKAITIFWVAITPRMEGAGFLPAYLLGYFFE